MLRSTLLARPFGLAAYRSIRLTTPAAPVTAFVYDHEPAPDQRRRQARTAGALAVFTFPTFVGMP
jgi:hypothetical protein